MGFRMRRVGGGLFAAGMLFAYGLLRAQQNSTFEPGERLNYQVTWSVFNAGQISATLERTGSSSDDAYQVVTTARSQGFVSLIYNLDDEYRSLFDPRTGCSRRITKRVNEGRRHKNVTVIFNAQKRVAVLDERNPAGPAKHAEHPIPACVQDVISAFYYVRSQPLRIGEQIRLPINDGNKTTDVIADVEAREQIDTPLGKLFAFRVEPKVFGNLYKRKGRMLVWFSDDSRHLPLRIKAMISYGTITGTLQSVTGASARSPAASPPKTR